MTFSIVIDFHIRHEFSKITILLKSFSTSIFELHF